MKLATMLGAEEYDRALCEMIEQLWDEGAEEHGTAGCLAMIEAGTLSGTVLHARAVEIIGPRP